MAAVEADLLLRIREENKPQPFIQKDVIRGQHDKSRALSRIILRELIELDL